MKWNMTPRNRQENPFSALQKDIDGVLDNFFSPFGTVRSVRPETLFESRWAPRMDIEEDSGRIYVKAELPGVNESDIDLSIAGNVLTIAGEKKEEKKEKDGRSIISERFYGSFSRSITLPADVGADKITADFKDGILSIEIPLEESKQSKKIEIKK